MGLLQALGSACLVLAMIYYFDEEISLGRGIAAMSGPGVFALMLGSRAILSRTSLFLYGPKRVLVVGTGSTGISAVREIISRPDLNLKVLGFLDEKGENIGKSLVNPGIIGGLSDLEMLVKQQNIDREVLRLKFAGVTVEDAHTVFERISGRIALEKLSPSWLIFSDGFRKNRFLLVAKRSMDIAAALFAITLTLPIMGLVALAIILESGHPVLFRQQRVGLHGVQFEIFKFRSMRQDEEKD